MPILSRDEALTNLKDNVLKSLETAGGFGQGSSEPEQNVLTPFPKFTSARTMLAFVVSTCNETLAPSTLEGSTKVRTVPVGSRKLQVTRICLLGA